MQVIACAGHRIVAPVEDPHVLRARLGDRDGGTSVSACANRDCVLVKGGVMFFKKYNFVSSLQIPTIVLAFSRREACHRCWSVLCR